MHVQCTMHHVPEGHGDKLHGVLAVGCASRDINRSSSCMHCGLVAEDPRLTCLLHGPPHSRRCWRVKLTAALPLPS